MASETDERVLQSFLDGDESLVSTATIEAAQRGFSAAPPQLGDDLVAGVTEHRLLWFDDELATVELSAIQSVDVDSVSHRSAPTIVRIGSFAMIAGLVAALVGSLFAGQPLRISLALAAGGVLAFAATIAIARLREDTASGFEKHRLTVDAGDELIQLWGSEEPLGALATALDEQRAS